MINQFKPEANNSDGNNKEKNRINVNQKHTIDVSLIRFSYCVCEVAFKMKFSAAIFLVWC